MSNIGGSFGGAITAALFLQSFVDPVNHTQPIHPPRSGLVDNPDILPHTDRF
jgi:hypothetical protein